MKYFELTKEEQQLLNDFETNKLIPVKNSRQLKGLYQKVAHDTLNKTRNINIRVSERILARLKAKAAEEGIPYQTLISSILHRCLN